MKYPTHPTEVSSRCTIQLHDGEFCNVKSMEYAPFPVCAHHALVIFRHVADRFEAEGRDPIRRATVMTNWLDERQGEDPYSAALGEPSVYYLLMDGVVKIGFTTRLHQRLSQYPPMAVLLATEVGGRETEVARHAEFREYLVAGREWFTPGPRLRQHIESLPDYRSVA